jgi:TRAP-type uncharacterized transport system substrate-binding protein
MVPQALKRNRDLLIITVPAVLLVVGAFGLTLFLMRPAPPREIVMSTGTADGTYHAYALRYREILARDGVTLRLWPSSGALQNLQRLTDSSVQADVALIQGGLIASGTAVTGLASLGSAYYEPLWVFYRSRDEIHDLRPLRGKMVAIGQRGSGTGVLATALLRSSGLAQPPTTLLEIGGRAAVNLLTSGGIDAVFMMAPAESPLVGELMRAPGVRLLSFKRAEAYTRRHFYLSRLTLPMGALDLEHNIPDHEVVLLATTANLIARQDLHPALAYLLLEAATELHRPPTLFSRLRQFPAPEDSELALSPEAKRYYQSGPPFLQRYLPYWAANLVDRLLVLLLPAVAVLFPVMRLLPSVYRWRVTSRIYRWYGRLKEMELELDERPDREQLDAMLRRLDQMDRAVSQIDPPLAFSENLYVFRQHIDLVRERALARIQREAGPGSAPEPAAQRSPTLPAAGR